MISDNKKKIIDRMKDIANKNPVFIDTETTGFNHDDEVIEITVLDIKGNILINELLKPMKEIPYEAYEVHGISNTDVFNKRNISELWSKKLESILYNNIVCIYNSEFDIRLIKQSLAKHNITLKDINDVCIMKSYAEFTEEWNEKYNTYKWFKLVTAADQCNLSYTPPLHRSYSDTELTRKLFLYMKDYSSSS